jgi:hypothetical protein
LRPHSAKPTFLIGLAARADAGLIPTRPGRQHEIERDHPRHEGKDSAEHRGDVFRVLLDIRRRGARTRRFSVLPGSLGDARSGRFTRQRSVVAGVGLTSLTL